MTPSASPMQLAQAHAFEPSSAFPGTLAAAGSEVEQLQLEQVPVRNAIIAGGRDAYCSISALPGRLVSTTQFIYENIRVYTFTYTSVLHFDFDIIMMIHVYLALFFKISVWKTNIQKQRSVTEYIIDFQIVKLYLV